jgi:hypothetical protein
MQTTLNHDTGLTDQQLRDADETCRQWYLRVLTLVNDTGCSVKLALQAIELSDKEQTR